MRYTLKFETLVPFKVTKVCYLFMQVKYIYFHFSYDSKLGTTANKFYRPLNEGTLKNDLVTQMGVCVNTMSQGHIVGAAILSNFNYLDGICSKEHFYINFIKI